MDNIKAVIFDLDGTLLNTEPIEKAGWNHALERYGIVIDNDEYLTYCGHMGPDVEIMICEKHGLDIQSGETIIEVGPGKGALTLPMAENLQFTIYNLQIIAIEKDGELIRQLNKKIKDLELKNIKVIEGDVLKILPELVSKLKIVNYKLVGNIPYYITGKLLRTISELKNKPAVSVLMVQKEVAERICATPPKMNLLAAATQYWTNPKIILNLKAKEFDPPPEVDSAVIKLKSKIQNLEPKIAKKYYKLIHVIFKQPRKTLLNNLKEGTHVPKEELETMIKSLDLPLNCRPQNLTIEKILKLTKLIN